VTAIHIALSLLPLALYLLAAAALCRAAGRPAAQRATFGLICTASAVVAHGYVLFGAIDTPTGISLAITDSASLVGWVVAASTLLIISVYPLRGLGSALLLTAGILGSGTGLVTGFQTIASPQWEVSAHIVLAALAAGWLTIAAVTVVLLHWQDARIRSRQPLGPLGLLPPMETMETTLFRTLGAGFTVLTLALLTGLFTVHNLLQQHLVHKTTLAILAWLVFGTLLWGRWKFGWRGRQALRFTLAGFIILALAYFGTKFVLENLLGRHWG